MRHVFVLLLILSCSAVHAAEADERTVLAAKVIDLIRMKSAEIAGSPEQCNPPEEVLTKRLAESYRASPGNFSGISPQSAYWPEVGRIWREFYAAQCAEAPDDNPIATMTRTYAAQMSLQELRDAVSYWSSASGRAMVSANEQMSRELKATGRRDAAREPSKAAIAYRMAMRELKARYQAEPR